MGESGRVAELERRIAELEQHQRGPRGPRWTVRLTYPGKDNMRAWNDWFARYGLPTSNEIPHGAELVSDSDTRTFTVLRKVRDDNGRDIAAGTEILKETVTVVVRGPVEPFPPGCEVTVD